MASHSGLTSSQIAQFRRDGFLHIPDAIPASTLSTLLSTTRTLLSSIDLSTHPLTRFSTGSSNASSASTSPSAHVGDDYFLTSGDKIRFFFEEAAFSPPPNPTLLYPPPLAINKIGHSLHTLSPPFRSLTLSPANVAIAHSLGFRDPRVLQSMVICKQPGIGGAVPPHQDSTFLYTNPPSAVGWWYALEDADAGNGGLWFERGSHRRSGVTRRFVKKEEGGVGFREVREGERRWPEDEEGEEGEGEGDGEWELVEVKRGGLVLIHGNVVHKSERNEGDGDGKGGRSRWAYTFHVIEGRNEYDEENWLQPKERAEGFTRLIENDDDG